MYYSHDRAPVRYHILFHRFTAHREVDSKKRSSFPLSGKAAASVSESPGLKTSMITPSFPESGFRQPCGCWRVWFRRVWVIQATRVGPYLVGIGVLLNGFGGRVGPALLRRYARTLQDRIIRAEMRSRFESIVSRSTAEHSKADHEATGRVVFCLRRRDAGTTEEGPE